MDFPLVFVGWLQVGAAATVVGLAVAVPLAATTGLALANRRARDRATRIRRRRFRRRFAEAVTRIGDRFQRRRR